MRLVVRGFEDGKKKFEDHVTFTDEELVTELPALLPKLAEKHAAALAGDAPFMIEIEFVDEAPDPNRFFRFGTDPRGMVLPIKVLY